MIIRLFTTAADPDDIERGKQLFADVVRPAFESFDGCNGVDLYIGLEEHSGDLVEVATISRWDSFDAIERATSSAEYDEALGEIRSLFRETPITRHFQTVE